MCSHKSHYAWVIIDSVQLHVSNISNRHLAVLSYSSVISIWMISSLRLRYVHVHYLWHCSHDFDSQVFCIQHWKTGRSLGMRLCVCVCAHVHCTSLYWGVYMYTITCHLLTWLVSIYRLHIGMRGLALMQPPSLVQPSPPFALVPMISLQVVLLWLSVHSPPQCHWVVSVLCHPVLYQEGISLSLSLSCASLVSFGHL